MFKSSARQLFFLGFLLLCASSCSLWRANQNGSPSPAATPGAAPETDGAIPFSTLEPPVYQTEIVSQIFTINGDKTERKIFAARSGARRVTIFNFGEKDETARIESENGSVFSVHHGKKIYAAASDAAASPVSAEAAGNDFLTAEWLNQKSGAAFENLGTENNLTKFRVRLGGAENKNSEILVYFDEALKLPVRQEFYNSLGEQKNLFLSVELKNFKTEAGENLFQVPGDYRQVTPKEFQEILWKERMKNE